MCYIVYWKQPAINNVFWNVNINLQLTPHHLHCCEFRFEPAGLLAD